MAVIKNDYSTLPVIAPYYINIEKSLSQADTIIIVDTINNNEHGKINLQLTGTEIWLQIAVDNKLTVLSTAPTGVLPFTPGVQYLDKARLRLKTAELFTIEYNDSAKDDDLHRTAVTGYQMGTFDKVYVKIETENDTIKIYHD